MNFVERC